MEPKAPPRRAQQRSRGIIQPPLHRQYRVKIRPRRRSRRRMVQSANAPHAPTPPLLRNHNHRTARRKRQHPQALAVLFRRQRQPLHVRQRPRSSLPTQRQR